MFKGVITDKNVFYINNKGAITLDLLGPVSWRKKLEEKKNANQNVFTPILTMCYLV